MSLLQRTWDSPGVQRVVNSWFFLVPFLVVGIFLSIVVWFFVAWLFGVIFGSLAGIAWILFVLFVPYIINQRQHKETKP